MRVLSPGMLSALASGSVSFARLWTITRKDGIIKRFTSHDVDIVFSSQTYRATNSFIISDISHTVNTEPQSASMQVILGDDVNSITASDLNAGLYDSAIVKISLVLFDNLAAGEILLLQGYFGSPEIKPMRGTASLNITGSSQKALQLFGEKYSPECRAELGDARCKVNLSLFSYTGAVLTVITPFKFTISISSPILTNVLDFAKITWTTGNNVGHKSFIISQTASGINEQIIIEFSTPNPILVGDTFTTHLGCNKTPVDCSEKFGNIINYRGEPFPTIDSTLKNKPTPL